MLSRLGYPHVAVLETRPIYTRQNIESLTGDVVANDCHCRVLDVLRDKAMKLFLTCRVPNLHSNHLVVNVNSFRQKVDSDRCLLRVILFITYLALAVEHILREAENNRGLADRLVSEEHDFVLDVDLILCGVCH